MLGGVLITAVVVGAPIIVLGAVRGLRLRHPGSSSVANVGQNSLVLPLTHFETKFMKNLLFSFRVVGVVSRLLAGRFAVRIQTGTGDFHLLHIFRASSVAHSAHFSLGIGVISWR